MRAPRRPEVSVLMPARDAGRYVSAALGSVLASRGVDLEVVFIDHGSVDDTAAIVQSHGDARVRVVPVPRRTSFADALNLGWAACRAGLVARMDADDVMGAGRLRDDVAMLRDNPSLSAVSCRVALLGDGHEGRGMARYVAWQNQALSPADIAREIWVEQPVCNPATTFRRGVLDDVGGYRHGPWPEDYDFFFRMWLCGGRIEKRAAVQHHWREHAGQATHTHPRHHRDALCALKVAALCARYRIRERPVFVIGAGKEGGRIGRVLHAAGARPAGYFDLDPRRIGRARHGASVFDAAQLGAVVSKSAAPFVIGAVGQSGARAVVRAQLRQAGLVEGEDAVIVA